MFNQIIVSVSWALISLRSIHCLLFPFNTQLFIDDNFAIDGKNNIQTNCNYNLDNDPWIHPLFVRIVFSAFLLELLFNLVDFATDVALEDAFVEVGGWANHEVGELEAGHTE